MGDRLGTTDIGRKEGGLLCPFLRGGKPVGWLEFNVPLQHKYGYVVRDEGGKLGPHLTHVAGAYLHAKFHLDPSNRLATIHQRYRQTGQTDSTTVR